MPGLVRQLAPLVVHAGFCLLSAALLSYALRSGNYAVLVGLPLVFLAVVLPVLYFGWPPPLGYLMDPLERVARRRVILVSLGALLVGFSVFSAVTFGSPLLGAQADGMAFAAGAALLYVAHRGERARPEL